MTDPLPLVILFGATGGIGSAVARRLSGPERRLLLVGRDAARLNALRLAGEVESAVADVTESGAVDRVFERARELAPEGPEGVLHAVGSLVLKPAHLTTAEEWDDVLALNLTSAFHVVRNAGKHMARGGSVVFCSSAAAACGLPNHEAIAAAKAGLEGLVRSAAATYARRELRFNAVALGLVDTPLAARITGNDRAREASSRMHPLGRIGDPEDAASAITWLLDPRNAWVTGTVLPVDGGLGRLRSSASS